MVKEKPVATVKLAVLLIEMLLQTPLEPSTTEPLAITTSVFPSGSIPQLQLAGFSHSELTVPSH